MIKGACYVRVSTDNQLENYSIEEQTDRLRSYCKAKDITIVKFYTDGGYSGGNINRPALQQMLLDVENNVVDTVVVYKLDRLSRSQKDTLMLIEDRFLSNHVDFISVNENFDTSSALGRAMIGILSVFAQLEKDQITERFTMGRIGRAKNGYYHGGAYAPTGYDYIDGNLVINEYEALQINDLFQRFAKGYSLHNCWQYMQKQYTTKYGAWTSETLVRNILKNEVYIGKVKFKNIAYPGNHEPIISKELFDEVQHILKSSQKDSAAIKRSPFRASNLLTSLLYCGNCGAKYHGEHGNYSCYSRTKDDKKYIVDPDCRNKKWRITELDNLIIKYLINLDYCELVQNSNTEKSGNDYSIRLKEIDKQIEKLINLYQFETMPIDMITSKIKALAKEKKIFKEHIAKPDSHAETVQMPRTAKSQFTDLLTYGSLQEKRHCLTMLVDKIILDGNAVNIILRKLQ